jgi:uncharacterized membrane protein YfcA
MAPHTKFLTVPVGAIVGGYVAAHYARRLDPAKARIGITLFNSCITALVFWKTYG